MGEKLPLLSYLQLLQSMTLLILQLVMIYNGLYFYQAVFWHWEMMLAPWPSVPRFLYNNLSRQTFLKLNVNFLNNNCQRKRVKECKDEGNICLPCRCAWLDLGRFSYNHNCVYVSLFFLFFKLFFSILIYLFSWNIASYVILSCVYVCESYPNSMSVSKATAKRKGIDMKFPHSR